MKREEAFTALLTKSPQWSCGQVLSHLSIVAFSQIKVCSRAGTHIRMGWDTGRHLQWHKGDKRQAKELLQGKREREVERVRSAQEAENMVPGHSLALRAHCLVLMDKHIRKLAKGEILEEQSIKPIAKLVCNHAWSNWLKKVITAPSPSSIKQLTWDAGRWLFTNLGIDFGCGFCLCKCY